VDASPIRVGITSHELWLVPRKTTTHLNSTPLRVSQHFLQFSHHLFLEAINYGNISMLVSSLVDDRYFLLFDPEAEATSRQNKREEEDQTVKL